MLRSVPYGGLNGNGYGLGNGCGFGNGYGGGDGREWSIAQVDMTGGKDAE